MKIFENPPLQHSLTRAKVAIITGLSDPRHCQLSSSQKDFLKSVVSSARGNAGMHLRAGAMSSNFPFLNVAPKTEKSEKVDGTSILVASWNNIRQYLCSGRKAYRDSSTPHWRAFFDSAETFYLLTGSCGLQMVAQALRFEPSEPTIEILAFGPVASKRAMGYIRTLSKVNVTKVRGAQDWLSRNFFRSGCHEIPNLGHLGYWEDPRSVEYACNWLSSKTSELSEQVVTCPNEK